MPVPAQQQLQHYRFGVFTADIRAGELRKNGIRVKLQELPFRLLVTLLERPGEVVSREELRTRLWPDGSFVDFDHSLSSALNKLRNALNDSATHPRYVETVGRRGYRFIYPVSPVNVEPELPGRLRSSLRRHAAVVGSSLFLRLQSCCWPLPQFCFSGLVAATVRLSIRSLCCLLRTSPMIRNRSISLKA